MEEERNRVPPLWDKRQNEGVITVTKALKNCHWVCYWRLIEFKERTWIKYWMRNKDNVRKDAIYIS